MLQREYQHDIVCDACNGTRYVGVTNNGDGFEFIECEKCRGTGHLSMVHYGFSNEDDDE